VKYSPERSTVLVRLREENIAMKLEIKDTGYGIAAESLPHIFDKFYRITDNENVKEVTGSGLGLSLVREIVEIHGGKIGVESIIGKGSTFSINIPKEPHPVKDKEEETALI
jgi:signal transduction histidine kinase